MVFAVLANCNDLLLALPQPGFLAGPFGIRVGQGIIHVSQTLGRKEPSSAEPPSGGRAALLTTFF